MTAIINHPPFTLSKQMAWAVAFSLAAHLLLVVLLPRLPAHLLASPALRARLEPIPAVDLSRVTLSHPDMAGVRQAMPRSLSMPDRAPTSAAATGNVAAAARTESASPQVDLDAAKAAARAFAREPVPRNSLDIRKAPITVESAIARATRPDIVIETRGAAGERVVQDGKTRCMTPTLVPWFMEGITVPTQCEVRKG